jgi:hypothetical protein
MATEVAIWAMVRTRTSMTNLHSFWDGLPGRGETAGEIGKLVQEIEQVTKEKDSEIKKELDTHQTFESWGQERWELSKRAVYLNGELKVAAGRGTRDAPEVQAEYPTACGIVARVQMGKAGIRLADQVTNCFRERNNEITFTSGRR